MYTGPALDRLLRDNPTIAEDLRRQDETISRMIARAEAEQVEAEAEASSAPAIEPATRRRKRRPTLATIARQAARAGLEVSKYEVDPDTGKITIVPGKPEIAPAATERNEWDTVQ
jgi:hypothetical protein